MGSLIGETRDVPVAGHGMAAIHCRMCYCGQDRPRVLIVWAPEVRARGWRLVDRPGCIEHILRGMARDRGLNPDCVRVVEALHDDEFAAIECEAGPDGRPHLGTYFQADRPQLERWVGWQLDPFPGLPDRNHAAQG
jgi:hypothetical protein